MVKLSGSTAIFGGAGIAAIAVAIFFIIKEIRGAGQDLSESITKGVLSGVGESFEEFGGQLQESIGGIGEGISQSFSDFGTGFSEFLESEGEKQRQTQEDFFNFISQQQQNFDTAIQQQQENFDTGLKSLADFFSRNQTIRADEDDLDFDEDLTPSPGLSTQEETLACPCGNSIVWDSVNRVAVQKCLVCQDEVEDEFEFGGSEFNQARNEIEFRKRQQEEEEEFNRTFEVTSELDDDEQEFGFGGVGFQGGTIRENPVDTLSEVLDIFPDLTASQAADFLNEYSGISPSDALRVRPDIKNITANIDGENVQIENIGISDLDAAAKRAEELTCQLFGLNCPDGDGM